MLEKQATELMKLGFRIKGYYDAGEFYLERYLSKYSGYKEYHGRNLVVVWEELYRDVKGEQIAKLKEHK